MIRNEHFLANYSSTGSCFHFLYIEKGQNVIFYDALSEKELFQGTFKKRFSKGIFKSSERCSVVIMQKNWISHFYKFIYPDTILLRTLKLNEFIIEGSQRAFEINDKDKFFLLFRHLESRIGIKREQSFYKKFKPAGGVIPYRGYSGEIIFYDKSLTILEKLGLINIGFLNTKFKIKNNH